MKYIQNQVQMSGFYGFAKNFESKIKYPFHHSHYQHNISQFVKGIAAQNLSSH